MPFDPGERVSHYEIVGTLGAGGMGEVYRARDTRLGRDVALKFVLQGPTPDSSLRRRLEREARALAALNHPHIVTIHEIGEIGGIPYLVLEWLQGGSLRDRMTSRPWLPGEFLQVARPVAEALAAAHDHGIIHRDVKPANVLMTEDGRVKLADFGLATARQPDADATRTAGIVGTVAYMSPEQARGAEVGPASDVYSFGLLAYELLTGARAIAGQPRKAVPAPFAPLIDRALQQEPGARFANGRELIGALKDAAAGAESAAAMPASRSQQIKFCRTSDGVSIAYTAVGAGPVIVRVLGHFTHLEMEWEWPDLRGFWETLASRHTVVRYDGRGMGLSDKYDGEFTEEGRQADLDAVLRAVGAARVVLLGISEGGWTAAQFTTQHPDRIAHLVLYGAYARGARVRPGHDPDEERALMTLVRKGWGRDTPCRRS